MKRRVAAWLLVVLSAVPLLQGCFGAVAAGAASGVLVALDRRSVGAQTEDETIEWKASNRVTEKFGDYVHINYTSYNRKVLMTGEVPNAEYKAAIRDLVAGIENVEGVYDELVVAGMSSIAGRTTDTYLTSKVKARFIDAGQFSPYFVKVVTEASTVFLLGIVNAREAQAAIEVARTTGGVSRVVNVMDIRSDAEIQKLDAVIRGNRPQSSAQGR